MTGEDGPETGVTVDGQDVGDDSAEPKLAEAVRGTGRELAAEPAEEPSDADDRPRPSRIRISQRVMGSATSLAWLAVGAGLLFFAVYLFAVQTSQGQEVDNEAYAQHIVHEDSAQQAADDFLDQFTYVAGPAAGLIIILSSLFRGRPVLALAVMVLFAAALGLAGLLETLLPRAEFFSDDPLSGNTYPSGYAVVASALGFAFLMVAGQRWRQGAAVFVGLVVAFNGWAILASGNHRPSDILGAYLLTLGVSSAVAMLLVRFFGTDMSPRRRVGYARVRSEFWTGTLWVFTAVMMVLVGVAVIGNFGTLTAGDPEWDYLSAVAVVVVSAFVINLVFAHALNRISLDRPIGEVPLPDPA